MLQNLNELEQISTSLNLPSFTDFSNNWRDALTSLAGKLINVDATLNQFTRSNEPYFVTNLLFSILLNADRMNAAGITSQRVELDYDAVDNFVNNIPTLQGNDFTQRQALYEHCNQQAQNQNLNQKIFTLSAATGYGKTLSALNFSLRLRERIRNDEGYTP